MRPRAAAIAGLIALVLQVLIAMLQHRSALFREQYFATAGSLIALSAGILYAWLSKSGRGSGVIGGLVVGGSPALLAIALAVHLRDVIPEVLLFGGATAAAAAALGGWLGSFLVRRRR